MMESHPNPSDPASVADSLQSTQAPMKSGDSKTRKAPGILGWLGRIAGIGAILLAIAVGVLRAMAYEIDHGMANAITIGGLGLAAIGLLFWFVTMRRIPKLIRLAAIALPVLAIFLAPQFVEFQGVSGEMIPQFRIKGSIDRTKEIAKLPEVKDAALADIDPEWMKLSFPQFLGSNRDGRIADIRYLDDWSQAKPEIVWQVPVGAGWSGIALSQGRLVTIEQHDDIEKVVCYRLQDGKILWTVDDKARHYNFAGGLGPRSTPTIEGDRVYTLGGTGIVQCIELKTGKRVWKEELLKISGVEQDKFELAVNWGRAASPLLVGNALVLPLGGIDNCKSLIAFNKESGEKLWSTGAEQISYASPMLAKLNGQEQIISVNEKTVTGHDPSDGKELWSVKWDGASNGPASCTQPIALNDSQLLLSKGYGGTATLLNFEKGVPAGDPCWKNNSGLRTKFASPIEYKGCFYGLSDGILECLDAATGKRKWKSGRYGHGQLLLVGDLLLITSEDGDLVLVEPTPEAYREKCKMSVLKGITWNIPAVAGEYVFMRNGTSMACLKLPVRK